MNKLGAYQKKALNIKSVQARFLQLSNATQKDAKVNRRLSDGIVSQAAFAALNIPSLGITPLSLNTLKTLANQVISSTETFSGFARLDALRISVANDSKERRRASKSNHSSQPDSIEAQLRAKLNANETLGTLRSRAYSSLLDEVARLVRDNTVEEPTRRRLARLVDRHHALYESLLAPQVSRIGVSQTLQLVP